MAFACWRGTVPDRQTHGWLGFSHGCAIWPVLDSTWVGVQAGHEPVSDPVCIGAGFSWAVTLYEECAGRAAPLPAVPTKGHPPGYQHTVRMVDLSPRVSGVDYVASLSAAVLRQLEA
jgi:hypothetical protein